VTYVDAVREARDRSNALRAENLARVDKALRDYINELTKNVRKLTGDNKVAARRAIRLAEELRTPLAQTLERAVATGRAVAFNDILKIHTSAAERYAAQFDVSPALLARLHTPGLTMAGAWESLGKGASTWRTLLRGYSDAAINDVQQVMTSALLSGLSAKELAERLRPYLAGSEPFQKAFKGTGVWTDAMLRKAGFKQDARRLRYNADRIAYSEIHNARLEAELQAFAADPFVEAVRWTLSPYRGLTEDHTDECDDLAGTDFYEMGAGVYPVDAAPTSPHPWCRCEVIPITRPVERSLDPKPSPKLRNRVPPRGKRTAGQAAKQRVNTMRAVGAGDGAIGRKLAKLSGPPEVAKEFTALGIPDGIVKKHDVIYWLRTNTKLDADEIVTAMNTRLGFGIKKADVMSNIKWYNTEKIPGNPILIGGKKPPVGKTSPITAEPIVGGGEPPSQWPPPVTSTDMPLASVGGLPLARGAPWADLADPDKREEFLRNIRDYAKMGVKLDNQYVISKQVIAEFERVITEARFVLKKETRAFFGVADAWNDVQRWDTFWPGKGGKAWERGILTFPGVRTMGATLERARAHAGAGSGTTFEVILPKGTRAISANVSGFPELQVLPGSRYMVEKVVTTADGTHVTLRLIDDGALNTRSLIEFKKRLEEEYWNTVREEVALAGSGHLSPGDRDALDTISPVPDAARINIKSTSRADLNEAINSTYSLIADRDFDELALWLREYTNINTSEKIAAYFKATFTRDVPASRVDQHIAAALKKRASQPGISSYISTDVAKYDWSREGVKNLDSVHAVPTKSTTIVLDEVVIRGGASGMYSDHGREYKRLEISPKMSRVQQRATFYHEMGHAFDNIALGRVGHGFGSERQGQLAQVGAIQSVMKAIKETNAFKNWAATARKYRGVGPTGKFFNYVISDVEIFARSYAQYIANKSGDKAVMGVFTLPGYSESQWQWSPTEFATIHKAFDKLLSDFGLLRKKP
jgi:hypothetical protein